MKSFFKSTYYFWIITKFIFAIASFISSIGNIGMNDLSANEKLANYIGIFYVICLVLDLIFSLNGYYYKLLKYFIGAVSVILGIIIFIVLLKVNVISIPLTLLFVIWIFLLGIFDLLQTKRIKN